MARGGLASTDMAAGPCFACWCVVRCAWPAAALMAWDSGGSGGRCCRVDLTTAQATQAKRDRSPCSTCSMRLAVHALHARCKLAMVPQAVRHRNSATLKALSVDRPCTYHAPLVCAAAGSSSRSTTAGSSSPLRTGTARGGSNSTSSARCVEAGSKPN